MQNQHGYISGAKQGVDMKPRALSPCSGVICLNSPKTTEGMNWQKPENGLGNKNNSDRYLPPPNI